MAKAQVFVAALLLVAQATANAYDGALDIAFGFLGEVELTPTGMAADAPSYAKLSVDGQHRIVGCIRTLSPANTTVPWIFRLTPDGGNDTSFAGTGSKFVAIPSGASYLSCDGFAVYPDGRILLASYDGSNQYILRMKADGGPDTSFNGTGTLTIARTGNSNDFIDDAVVASDGSVYIAYSRATANGARFLVRHILDNGTVDGGFGPGGGGATLFDGFALKTGVTARDDYPSRILLTREGSVVVTGHTTPTTSGNSDFAAARLTSTGLPDSGFGSSGAVIVALDLGYNNADLANSSALDERGRLVMAGYAQRTNASNLDFAVVRLDTGGVPDTTFSGDGKTTIAFDLGGVGEDVATSVVVQTDGRILVGGYAHHASGSSAFDWAVARLLDNGALDGTFNGTGKETFAVDLGGDKNDFLYSVVADGSDFILMGESSATATTEAAILARLRIDLIFASQFGG
jgi:uncharacterized delta-60 repeat protein